MTALVLEPHMKRRWSVVSEQRAVAILARSATEDTAETVVYALVGVDGLAYYVGCCKNGLGYRLTRHCYFAERGKTWKVSQWIRDTEYDVFVVVLERSPSDPREAELQWLRYFREQDAPLTNHTGMPPSAEHRARITEANNLRWARVKGVV